MGEVKMGVLRHLSVVVILCCLPLASMWSAESYYNDRYGADGIAYDDSMYNFPIFVFLSIVICRYIQLFAVSHFCLLIKLCSCLLIRFSLGALKKLYMCILIFHHSME